ncbi:hypothetical protein N7541_000165 [Penicillium brevicompactum]|uniref:Extracellular protein n=1 Tax=Penicillium brevicompactum TaxID=5074 RepID=A0A9W9Q9T4_PENBR|nr:uncharacterized protein N7506_002218 [Penicillium brevicompactum]KAJ5329670.1 hypothetical protein N7452_010060 [Penicillium brevicompactum]KAJ5348965.1 hypothetical protein N7506_002218 [Penicillium brevicompactum]KAJ5366224.1 hypothetical protein N7541_000165 [Penicillium brevicompactum]
MKGVAIISGLLASTVSAHMQLSTPYPIRSPLNKDAKGQKDYSYTNPLSSSGSDYPCKGYAKDDFEAVATWEPGSSQHMELEGSATHDGGSCQLALTYDQGKTFKVIESIEGDCPIAKKYDFDIPSDAPTGDALFAWTWFNKVGNREMYMNCAMITIGSSDSRSANGTTTENEKRDEMEAPKPATKEMEAPKPASKEKPKAMEHSKNNKAAKSSFDSLPDLFVANVDQTGKCVTTEGEAVHFPKPGPKLIGEAKGPGYKCTEKAPFLSEDAGSSDKNSTTTSDKIANSPKKDTPAAGDKTAKIAQPFGSAAPAPAPAADSRTLGTEASTSNHFSHYVGKFKCTDGELLCSPDGYTFALCNFGRPVFMGPVAAGTVCRGGEIIAAH